MTTATRKTKPVWGWNIHPGEILREEYMKPLGLSVYTLAKELKLTRPRLNDIVLGRRAITAIQQFDLPDISVPPHSSG